MSKRNIGIGVAILLVIAIVVGVFVFKSKTATEPEPTIDATEEAKRLDDYVDDMTEQEIKEQLEKPFTEEQQQVADEIFEVNHVPEVDESKEVIISEDGVATYTDVDGNTIEYQMDQDILDMDDSEAEDETAAILAALNDPTFGSGMTPGKNNNEDDESLNNQENSDSEDLERPTGSEAIGNAGTDNGDAPVGGYSSNPNQGFQEIVPGRDGSVANEGDVEYSGWIQ